MVKALVLEATQTKTVVLVVVVLVCVVVIVVEVLVPRVVAIVLRSRPQVGVVALIVEIAIVVPVTGGEHREFRNLSIHELGRSTNFGSTPNLI